MKKETENNPPADNTVDRSVSGGEMKIPDGYFVHYADFDTEEPFIQISSKDDITDDVKMPIPKSLAYFLSTHDIGSQKMREIILEQGRREVRGAINKAMGL